MKGSLLRIGVLTFLATGLFYGEAAAETGQVSSNSLSEESQNINPSFQRINELLTEAARKADIPPEVVKAIAWEESDWQQFKDGKPYVSTDGGIGIMQVTNYDPAEEESLKNDIEYNIKRGIEILNSKFDLIAADVLPSVEGADRHVIENWYFPVMAYNGIKPANSPLYQKDGTQNTNAYQEKVFAQIENDSFLDKEDDVYNLLGEFHFTTKDFKYDPDRSENIEFLKKKYTVNETHDSAYFFQVGDRVVVTGDQVNVRNDSSTSSTIVTQLDKNTPLVVTGAFEYEKSTKLNQFVWYPVETLDKKKMYISSAYLKKVNGKNFPDVNGQYQVAVDFLVAKGINGKKDGTFGTKENITRQDAAIFVAKALNLETEKAPQAGFTDVNPRALGAVNALKEAGITKGKTATTFGGGDLITRGELAKWIAVAFDLKAGNAVNPFSDVKGQYVDAVKALVENKVTLGKNATTFGTNEKATRGQFALFVYRAVQASQQ